MKKKKLWLIPVIALPVLALAIVLLILNSAPGGFTYRETNDGIAITGYTGDGTDIVIPAKVKGKPVTRIDRLAFDGLGTTDEAKKCRKITSVVIPESVTVIGENAFRNCDRLTAVTIPNGVTYIGEAAFRDTGLTSVSIPDGVTDIEEKTFIGCTDLKTVTIPGSVRTIGDRAFKNCSSLSDVYFAGTDTEWYAISTGIENDPLSRADIHMNAGEP